MSRQMVAQRGGHHARQDGWPVFMCGFRPFFVLTAFSAALLSTVWLLLFFGLLPDPLPGGSLLWHAHELLFGFCGAAIAGFALTAIPEFTGSAGIGRTQLKRMAIWWVAARLAYALAGCWPPFPGLWPAALCNAVFWALLLWQVAPPVWREPQRKHVSFAWSIAALAVLELGSFVAHAMGRDAMAWLYASVGVIMVLIIVAASRISMAVVNRLMEQGRPGEPEPPDVGYLARPPRRNLAIFVIAMCTTAEFFLGYNAVTGWTALAAAAAMLNLLNDWHVGRMLLTRWALMLYGCYWLMALGYGLMGLAWLGAALTPSAGRHLLMAGAMALSIFTVMAMAGRIHAGLWLDRRPWLPIAATSIVVAALLRAAAGIGPAATWAVGLLWLSGLLWAACFACYLVMAWPTLTGPRNDGQQGCAEPIGTGDKAHGRGEAC